MVEASRSMPAHGAPLADSRALGWDDVQVCLRMEQPGRRDYDRSSEIRFLFCWDVQASLSRLCGSDRRATLRFGSCSVVPGGAEQALEVAGRFQSLSIALAPRLAEQAASDLGMAGRPVLCPDRCFDLHDPLMLASAQGLYAALTGGDRSCAGYAALQARALASRLFAVLAPATGGCQPAPKMRAGFAAIADHVGAHLHEPISVDDLAALTPYRGRQFSRLFAESFGVTPYLFVTRMRVERAKRLIETTDRSLGEICFECGFSDQSHFTKVFRRQTGRNPAEFRRSAAMN